jgi:uncharacterized protein (DUF433 family)
MRDGITVDSGIHFGKPCVAGIRISVQSVLELVREGIGFGAIIRDYYRDSGRWPSSKHPVRA